MPPRSIWTGVITFGMVSIPVRLLPATQDKDVRFHLLHQPDHSRINFKRWCVAEDREVQQYELVKAYEISKDQYVEITDEDLEKMPLPSKHTIELSAFVTSSEIDPMYYDSPYYLAPDGAPADETFRVIRDAMLAKRQAGLGRVVLASRERRVVVEPRGPGMMMTTLRVASEVRAAADFFGELGDEALDEEMVKLAAHIIEQKSAEFDPSRFEDRYQKALHELVEAKLKGRKPVAAKAERPAAPVIDLMAALKSSLASESGAKPAAARKPAGRSAKATRATEKKRKRA